MCNCVEKMIKNMEQKGFENIEPPIEILSGRLYLSFSGRKKGQNKKKEIPVLLSKCPMCGNPYENKEDV